MVFLLCNVNHFLLFIIYLELTLIGVLLIFVASAVYYGIGAILVYALLILVVAAVETAIGVSLAISHVNSGSGLLTSRLLTYTVSRQ